MNTDLLWMNLNMNSNEPVTAHGFRHPFVIREFECGLLYRYGKFQARLEAGRHVRWGLGYALATVDLRKQTFTVAGQEVLKAKQEGQAALERARGESASLRNLANAARLLENNPALQNLRLMQSISASGNTLVMGLPTGFVPLKAGKPTTNEPGVKGNELGE